MRNNLLIKTFLCSALILSIACEANTQKESNAQEVPAPELTGGTSWLNTEKPLSLADLKGKIVLLDFWTYGCINCIHILPDLRRLEEKYANQLVIIGVHSAKYDNESDTENIRRVIIRYGIMHPVVNDSDYRIWNAYKVFAYPTLVLIDPDGNIVNRWIGEGQFDKIETAIENTIAEFRSKGKLNESPLKLLLERAKFGSLPLAFPGKILADAKSNRLFISDTNHNRIVIVELTSGKLIETIGNGEGGLKDGDYQVANFNRPQGLAIEGDTLFVADTANHAIRSINLKLKIVETIAGNGKQATYPIKGGVATKTSLSSPWDMVKLGDSLYVAMAGTHQIWRIDLVKQIAEPFAGTGEEAVTDGELKEATFAQPSGIASDGKNLYVADSEGNSIRQIRLSDGTVEKIAGGDLYIFGDADGEGEEAKFQHPLGVAVYNGKLLIADTYNHKIKLLDLQTKQVQAFLGTGKVGQADGTNPTFYEPGGISIANDKLYIADTNNHAVRVVDLKTKSTSTLGIVGLKPPQSKEEVADVDPNLAVIKLPEREVSLGKEISLIFDPQFPEGYHLNENAPNRYEITFDNNELLKIVVAKQRFNSVPLRLSLQALKEGKPLLRAKFNVYYCRKDNTGVCLIKTLQWEIPIKISTQGVTEQIELREAIRLDEKLGN